MGVRWEGPPLEKAPFGGSHSRTELSGEAAGPTWAEVSLSYGILFLTSQFSTKGKYKKPRYREWSDLLIQQVLSEANSTQAQHVHLETQGPLMGE